MGSHFNHDQVSTLALWRRVMDPLLRLVVLGVGLYFFMGFAQALLDQFHDRPLLNLAIQICLGTIALALYYAYGRLIERRVVTEVTRAGAAREWALGAACGAGLYTACAVSLMVLGIYKVEGLNPLSFMLPALALAVKSGVFEELIFRGVLHRSVESIFGSWVAIVVASFAFGFIHLMNPAATPASALYIAIEAGLLLSAAYLVTRRLWICMGFHMAWNYVQSAVFSGVVSGAVADQGLLKATISGPDFLTGGRFGMEQSIFALVYCTAMGVLLLVMAMRRGHLIPPIWSRGP